MSGYTPGALGALFSNTSRDDIKGKSSESLIKLFSKKTFTPKLRKSDSIAANGGTLNCEVQETKSKHDSTSVVNIANDIKCEVKYTNTSPPETLNIIGPTVIPSKIEICSSAQGQKKHKRKRKNDYTSVDVVEENSKYSGPSRKFQVLNEDAKKPQFDTETEARTVFVGNLPIKITGKILKQKVIL